MKQHGLGSLASGAIVGPTPGRADAVPADVEEQSYVIPADVVSALGEGNTLAGNQALKSIFRVKKFRNIPRPMRRGRPVAVSVSDGEFVVSPEEAAAFGGPEAIYGLVKYVRKNYIKKLKNLPPPLK